MKQSKKLLMIALSLLLGLSLVACVNITSDLTTLDPGSSSTTTEKYVADNTEHYDSITKTLTLEKSFEGKDFLSDGIGKATVDAYTDGDTTRFCLASGEIIVTRYYSVDTPESTGDVEKWGKAASNFTKTQLSGAKDIVLEATDTTAKHDSYGTRWLAYVWYREDDNTPFKLLNLELVENGYSENKGIDTSDFAYNSYFKQAHSFAKSIELRVHSSLDDPLFNDKPIEMTIKDFWENTDAYYNVEHDVGSKVTFYAYLESLYLSSSGTYTFTGVEIDEETGEKHSINVYAAYSSSTASTMKVGHLYKIVGSIQNYYGSFQVSGVSYSTVNPGAFDSIVVQKDYYIQFNSDLTYQTNYNKTVYTNLTVTALSNNDDGDLVITGTAQLRKSKSSLGDAQEFTITVHLDEGQTSSFAVGDELSFGAYQFKEDSGEYYVFKLSSISKNKLIK